MSLINNGVQVEHYDTSNMSPLMIAVTCGYYQIALKHGRVDLVEHGADVAVSDENGNTALMSASGRGYRDIAALIKNKLKKDGHDCGKGRSKAKYDPGSEEYHERQKKWHRQRGRRTAKPVDLTLSEACETLGVSIDSSKTEIKKAFHSKVGECHPDLFQGQPMWVRTEAEERTKKLNQAWEVLRKA